MASSGSWDRVLEIDARDAYWAREDGCEFRFYLPPRGALRFATLAFLSLYLATVLCNSSRTAPAPQGGRIGSREGRGNVRDSNDDGVTQAHYVSPEGLAMPLAAPSFPQTKLRVHYVAGVLLILLCVIQKHLLPLMIAAAPQRRGDAGRAAAAPGTAALARRVHRAVGYAAFLAVACMAGGGFFLRSYSALPHFRPAMVLFVAPWALLLFVGLVSARRRWFLLHSLAGNALFKACVAVPLARVLGTALQRVTCGAESRPIFSDAEGYYWGIALAALGVGCWAVHDAVSHIRHYTQM